MTKRRSILLRLAVPPAVAVLVVLFLAGLSLIQIPMGQREVPKAAPEVGTANPEAQALRPIAFGVPELTEEDALSVLKSRPSRAAIDRIWPAAQHRELLFGLLKTKGTPPEVRLRLLEAFEKEAPEKALIGARAIAGDPDIQEGPLLLTAMEVIAQYGRKGDLALLDERPGESHQLKTLRREWRDQLQNQDR